MVSKEEIEVACSEVVNQNPTTYVKKVVEAC
jgi:hypothetical protein